MHLTFATPQACADARASNLEPPDASLEDASRGLDLKLGAVFSRPRPCNSMPTPIDRDDDEADDDKY